MGLLRRLFGMDDAKTTDPEPSPAPAPAPAIANVSATPTAPSGRRITLSGVTRDWVTIDELDLSGTSRPSPSGRFAIVVGSIIGGTPDPDGRRDGAYAVLEDRIMRANGTAERPHDAMVADNGAFVFNDWMHSGELVGLFMGFHANGKPAFAQQFAANLGCNGLSADGRFAACQTLHSPGSPDDTVVALFDLEKGAMLAKFSVECGTAERFEFEPDLQRVHVLTRDGDRETYGFDGTMIDRQAWLDRRIARGDLQVIGAILKASPVPLGENFAQCLRDGLSRTAAEGEAWSQARACRLTGELEEKMGRPEAALAAYDRALLLDPQAGVSRRADKLRRSIGGGAAKAGRVSKIARQAERLGISHERLVLEAGGPKQWRFPPKGSFKGVEEAALDHFLAEGWSGAAAEGGLVLTLIKAASFERLSPRNADTFIEALYYQNVAFDEDRFDPKQLVEAVRVADVRRLAGNWKLISATAGSSPAFYPRVAWHHVEGLFAALGAHRLAEIAETFATAPYDLRAGWPDLTLWRDCEIRFVEVKSPTDQTHASQSRLISTLLVPLGFQVTLLEVQRSANEPSASR